MREPRFYEEAACAEVGGDFWFPEKFDGTSNSTEMVMAKSICGTCPHQSECAEWGLHRESHGIWGGLTNNERRVIRKERNIIVRGEYSA